jgi:hypothetical protein
MNPVDQRRFDAVVRAAVDAAGANAAPGHAVDTRDVLLALMRIDPLGEWDRLTLHFASEDAIGWAPVIDPQPASTRTWGTTPLSGTCAEALTVAVRLAEVYRTDDVSVGLAAVALVADPSSAAAMALTGGDSSRHTLLLDVLQEAVVGATLTDLVDAITAEPARRPARRLVRRRVSGSGPDTADREPVLPRVADDDDALTLLAAALDAVDDERLRQAYERMMVDADAVREVGRLVSDLPTRSAAAVVERARERYDTERPDAAQLIVTATMDPCERLARALWLLGLPERSLAIEAAAADARIHRIGEQVSDGSNAYTHLNAILSTALTLFIVRHVVVTHDWWPGIVFGLVLAYLTWTGLFVGDAVLTVLLWLWLGPAVGAIALALTLVDLLQFRSERRNAFCRTGLAVTTTQWRRHIRLRNANLARLVTATVALRRQRRLAAAGSLT